MAGLQDIRAGIIGAMQGLTGGGWFALTGRVLEGFTPFDITGGHGLLAESNTGSGSGALVHVGAGSCVDDDDGNANRYPTFSVDVTAWLAIPKDAPDDLDMPLTFIESARHALDAVLSKGGTIFREPVVHAAGHARVYQFVLSCVSRGCDATSAPALRYLLNEMDVHVRNESNVEILVA